MNKSYMTHDEKVKRIRESRVKALMQLAICDFDEFECQILELLGNWPDDLPETDLDDLYANEFGTYPDEDIEL